MTGLIDLYKQLTGETPECFPIKGEGSNRKYIRLSSLNHSLVGVIGENITENQAFFYISNHFLEQGLPVPKVLAISKDKLRYIQEDLGNVSLFDLLAKKEGVSNSEEVKSILIKCISILPDLQFKGGDKFDFQQCFPLPEMDERAILWDLNYFKYSFLKLKECDFSEPLLEDDFSRLKDDILKLSNTQTFMYRDFQSRNVMVVNNQPFFIDFQGGRKGPIYYDLASFLWQAKANFSEDERKELIEIYRQSLAKYLLIDEETFLKNLNLFVLFRTLQVLGAYGFRGLFERKSHFIESIPFALKNLHSVLLENDFSAYPHLVKVLNNLCEKELAKSFEQNQTLSKELKVRVFSFSYKKGIPEDQSGNGGGYVFDCRGVHNPGKYDEYKPLTGLDQPVIDFLEEDGEITIFLKHIYALAEKHVARYIERGFNSLMFCCGCTGGRHRSVYSAQHLGEYIHQKFGIEVEIIHRERGITQVLPSSKSR